MKFIGHKKRLYKTLIILYVILAITAVINRSWWLLTVELIVLLAFVYEIFKQPKL